MTKIKFNGVVTEVYTTTEKDKVNSIETGANKTEFATTNEATTATDNTKAMTPLRTKEAILALSPPPDLSGKVYNQYGQAMADTQTVTGTC